MPSASQQAKFTKLIDLSRGDRDIKKLMNSLGSLGMGRDTHQLTPSLIQLHFPSGMRDREVETARRFLHTLRGFQLSHFVRFMTDIGLLMETDCDDVFYSRPTTGNHHKDVSISVLPLNDQKLEVRVNYHSTTRAHLKTRELSRATYNTLFGLPADMDDEACQLEMMKFHRVNRFSELVLGSVDDIHVLFIPTGRMCGCYTIPLFGLTKEDARRRTYRTDEFYETIIQGQSRYVDDFRYTNEVQQILVDEIRINEWSGPRSTGAAQTYAMAELIFGYYLRSRDESKYTSDPNSLFVWFDTITENDESHVETYSIHLT